MRRTVMVAVGAGMGAVLLAVGAAWGGAALAAGADDPAGPGNLADAAAATPASASAAPGYQPSVSESSFVPIAPCRIVDTRKAGGKIAKNAIRSFYVGGTFGFAPQGGKTGGCGIPAGASAVAVSVATMTGAKSGYYTAYPVGQVSTSGFVNITPGRTERAAGTFALAAGSAKSLAVKNVSAGSANLVIDVQGYYVKQMEGMISSSGLPYAGSSRILDSSRIQTGAYAIQFDREVRYCAATATPYVSNYYASVSTWFDPEHPDTVHVYVWNATGAAADQYFYITVAC